MSISQFIYYLLDGGDHPKLFTFKHGGSVAEGLVLVQVVSCQELIPTRVPDQDISRFALLDVEVREVVEAEIFVN